MTIASIRLVVVAITVLNLYLTSKGLNPLPFSEEELFEGISAVVAYVSVVWSWWKNNNVTHEAQEAQVFLEKYKEANKKSKG